MKATNKYDDILHRSRPVSGKHSPMSLTDRAAQFSPFAALTGYDAVIEETGRLTDRQIELDEGGKALLDEKLRFLRQNLHRNPRISLRIFRPDERKMGGEYVRVSGCLKAMDPVRGCLVLSDGTVIDMERILEIRLEMPDLRFPEDDGMINDITSAPEDSYELPQG